MDSVRKSTLINRRFQLRLILHVAVGMVISLLSLVGMILLDFSVTIALMIAFLVMTGYTFALSHRIASSIDRVQHALKLLAREGRTRINLDRNDYFPEFASIIADLPTSRDTDTVLLKEARVPTKFDACHIMIVEDSEINRELMKGILESRGIQVTEAENGKVAVDLLASGKRFDAILMDGQMPEMDGFEATRLIREMPGLDVVPIVSMTASTRPEDLEKAIDVGMNTRIKKPVETSELLSTLASLLNVGTSDQEGSDGASEINIPPMTGVNSQQGLRRLNGNKQLYLKLLNRFVESYRNFRVKVVEASQSTDNQAAERLAHTLKGVAGNLGIREVQVLADQLVYAYRFKSSEHETSYLVNELARSLEAVISEIDPVLAVANSAAVATNLSEPEFNTKLQELRAMVNENDTRAKVIAEQLRSSGRHEKLMSSICDAVDQYEFEHAAELLKGIAVD